MSLTDSEKARQTVLVNKQAASQANSSNPALTHDEQVELSGLQNRA
jgi:hypothetical protein